MIGQGDIVSSITQRKFFLKKNGAGYSPLDIRLICILTYLGTFTLLPTDRSPK